MKETKFFHLGHFFTQRAFLATFFGAGLIAITEFLLPWLGVLQIPDLWNYITPITITFTLAIIVIFSAVAKNIASSIFLGTAAILSFYNPYSTIDYGFVSVLIIFLVTAFFAGFFASLRITGKSALLTIGIVMGLQGLIGAGVSIFTTIQGTWSINFEGTLIHEIGHGVNISNIPIYGAIVGIFSVIYMLVFILLSRRKTTVEHTNNKFAIIGQIIIVLSIVGALVFIAFSNILFITRSIAYASTLI